MEKICHSGAVNKKMLLRSRIHWKFSELQSGIFGQMESKLYIVILHVVRLSLGLLTKICKALASGEFSGIEKADDEVTTLLTSLPFSL